MDLAIIFADIVDYSELNSKDLAEPFYGNNNLQDVLDTQLFAANLIAEQMYRGDLWDAKYQLESAPTLEPFMDRFENVLAGWVLSFTVTVANSDISIC